MTAADVLKLIKEQDVQFLDLRFTDTKGKEQHVTLPASEVDEDLFKDGKMFDGSSIAGWKGINDSDMILRLDPTSAFIDPFAQYKQLNLTCEVVEPATGKGYDLDPRSIARRALDYLKSTGVADTAYFGPENEFFIFDDVRWANEMSGAFFEVFSSEAAWASGVDLPGGNHGHRPGVKGGYFPVPPVDQLHDVRAEMCQTLSEIGIRVEVHHHEVATAGQCEIGVGFGELIKKADEVQKLKYVIHNVAARNGKTVTFMPKPLVGDNGSGMHVHQSLAKNGKNLFTGADDTFAGGISQEAVWYIGGIIKHAKALNAFTNPSTNSYKRLVPGFEAPVMLAYSARNRSASIRIPYVANPKGRRIEVRFPDNTANPYLAFTAMMLAGLDGIINKIDPGPARNEDLYELEKEGKAGDIQTVCSSLDQALDALSADRDFLKVGGVMSDEMIDAYIALKMQEVTRLRQAVHPAEYDMYYSC